MEKEKNNKENANGNTDEKLNNVHKSRNNHIADFTSSKEIVEDATQYGEFMSSFFGWVSPEEQKGLVKNLENISKGKTEKNRND